MNSQLVVNVSGSLNSNGALDVTGSLPQGGSIRLDANGQLFLEKTTSGSTSFHFLFEPQRLVLSTPSLRLKTTASGANGNPFPSGLTIPGFDIDTAGAFDTGKLPLPSFDFDGIDISGKPGGKKKHNHIRLKRDSSGKVTFKVKSEQTIVNCRQKLSLTVESRSSSPKIKGSIQGNFCVLPDDFSLTYDSDSQCQFRGSAFGFSVKFGSTCAGVENNATGVCVLGDCN